MVCADFFLFVVILSCWSSRVPHTHANYVNCKYMFSMIFSMAIVHFFSPSKLHYKYVEHLLDSAMQVPTAQWSDYIKNVTCFHLFWFSIYAMQKWWISYQTVIIKSKTKMLLLKSFLKCAQRNFAEEHSRREKEA